MYYSRYTLVRCNGKNHLISEQATKVIKALEKEVVMDYDQLSKRVKVNKGSLYVTVNKLYHAGLVDKIGTNRDQRILARDYEFTQFKHIG
ncbi:MAG: hypothetical protein ACOH2T_19125 [Pseudomonas sp.]